MNNWTLIYAGLIFFSIPIFLFDSVYSWIFTFLGVIGTGLIGIQMGLTGWLK